MLRRGRAAEVIADLVRDAGVREVYWNEIDQPRPTTASRRRSPRQSNGTAAPGEAFAATCWCGRPSCATRTDAACACSRRSGSACSPAATCRRRCRRRTCSPPAASGRGSRPWQLEPARPDWAGGLRASWTPGEDAAQRRLQAFLADADRRLRGRPRPARPRRHLAAVAAPALRRDQSRVRSGTPPALPRPNDRRAGRDIDKFLSELGWREFCRHLLHRSPDLPERNLQPSFDAFPVARRPGGAAGLAARPHRLSDRRRRHAPALAHRLDAQPGAHDRGLVPGQAPADRLARGRGMVLGHAGRRRSGQQPGELAVGGGLRAPTPRPISASSIRCCRARNSIPTAPMCARWVPELGRAARRAGCTSPGRRPPLELASAGVSLGTTTPRRWSITAAARSSCRRVEDAESLRLSTSGAIPSLRCVRRLLPPMRPTVRPHRRPSA